MAHATLEMNGETFVLVPKREYTKLTQNELPEFPDIDSHGNMQALAAAQVAIARTIIKRRQSLSMSQKELALAAKMRPETLNRLEKGKVTPDTATIVKIDRALKKAESAKR